MLGLGRHADVRRGTGGADVVIDGRGTVLVHHVPGILHRRVVPRVLGPGPVADAVARQHGAGREAGREPDLIQSCGYKPVDYDLGKDVIQVSGEHDLFGDGSVVFVPTYGHTPGHQSLRVVLESGEVILAADACYFRQTLEELNIPPIAHDPDQMRRSLEKLRALQARGARIFYGHDPEFWKSVPQAPATVA